MLGSVKYDVEFSTTGRRLSNRIDFQKGFGAITGPNESGKTVIIEMIRYALFGTAALRGKLNTYTSIEVELAFGVRNCEYLVTRSLKNSIIREATSGDPLAVGHSEVNKFITTKVLGYDLAVFDTANVAMQGDLEKLGMMRPTDRKAMVDRLVGLDSIDELVQYAATQARDFGSEIVGLQTFLREPEVPVQPLAYRPSSELKEESAQLETMKQRLDRLKGELSAKRQEPTAPKETIPLPSEVLKPMADEYATRQTELKMLRNMPLPSAFTDEELDKFEQQNEAAQRWLDWDKLPKRVYTDEQLNQFIEDWHLIHQHEEQDDIKRQLRQCGEHECPACLHHWHDDPNRASALMERLLDLPDKPDTPPLSVRDTAGALRTVYVNEPPRLDRSPLSDRQIMEARVANKNKHVPGRIKELEAMPDTDFAAQYQQRLLYEHNLERYHKELDEYHNWKEAVAQKELEAATLEAQTRTLSDVRAALTEALMYEQALVKYQSDLSTFNEFKAHIDSLKEKQEGWTRAKKSLTLLKTLVKQHLLPSLNAVASRLLSEMTGGQRQRIDVDDGFEVLVDGQPLETLSGSGKSVANLALRLGLGQVLTNGVFSVFIGDEIDAFMDADRAENTSETLKNICSSVLQVVVVTHKYTDADYQIKLT